jgi:hypothetical protein
MSPAHKSERRRKIFWPMIVATTLNPLLVPASWVFWGAWFNIVFISYSILPVLAWILASRKPFAIVALFGIFALCPAVPFLAFLHYPDLLRDWSHWSGSSRYLGNYTVIVVLLFPLWMWTVWRAAMGSDPNSGANKP